MKPITNMYNNLKERDKEILNLLYQDESLSVNQLCETFNVSSVTIRKHLEKLEQHGYLIRTHGGAKPVFENTIVERQKISINEKIAIAKKAADLIEDGDRIIISAGTTTALILKFLYGKKNIHIVTNSTLLLTYSRINPSIKVTLVGGEFLANAEALTGMLSHNDFDQFYVEKSFIGADGFSIKGGVTAIHTELSEVCKKIIERSDNVYLLADSSKYGKVGFSHITKLTSMNTIITSKSLPDFQQKEITDLGVKLILA